MKLDRSNVVKMQSELEMLGFLKTIGTECRFVGITTRTPVTKMKTANPWHVIKNGKVVGECNLWKISRKIGVVNMNFCTAVEKRIAETLGVPAKEVEYVAGDVYYEHLMTVDGKPLPLVQHKIESERKGIQLQYFPQKNLETVYVNGAGEPVSKDEVKKYLYKESERPNYKPAVIGVYLHNIHKLSASGVVVEMPELAEVEEVLAD